jgi:hypothetical protein
MRSECNTNPSSSLSLEGEEQPIAWLTEIQTQRSTSGIFHQGSLLFCTLIVFSIEHPQNANSPSLHRQKTKASTQESSKPSGKLDHLFPTAYQYDH